LTKFLTAVAISASSLLLTGCTLFYPNWGATSLPEEPTTTSVEPATSGEASETNESDSSNTDADASKEPESTETEKPAPKKVDVDIIMAVVEADAGVLTVVAQLPGVSDTGGSCTIRFQAGNFEKKITVKAEPSSDYTQCYPAELKLSELKAGKGLVTVSYSSEKYVGTSSATSVEIP
jgi:hypothetical protein